MSDNFATDYYDKLLEDNPVVPRVTQPKTTQPVVPLLVPGTGGQTTPAISEKGSGIIERIEVVQQKFAESVIVSEKERLADIKKFGGEIGSTEYYRYKAGHPYRSFLPQQIGSSFGLKFPNQETWDK